MGRRFIILVIIFALSCKETTGIKMMMEKLGLREKEDPMPRTWFPEDPNCRPERCPVPLSQDWFRLNHRCCTDPATSFHCQKIDARHVVSFCMDTVQCPAGTYADLEVIIMRKYLEEPLCQRCSALQFQPSPTPSYMFHRPQCHHRRSQCDKFNAVNVVFGGADADDVCRCPHFLNFRPVPRADNDCILFNSSSGCLCEYHPCLEGQVMTAEGYQCMDASLAKSMDSFRPPESDQDFGEAEAGREDGVCLGPDCSEPGLSDPAYWVHTLQDLHTSYGLCVPAFLAIVACLVYRGLRYLWRLIFQGPARYDILVCIIIPSPKICEFVFGEINNSLPLLERIYGPLTLAHDEDFTHITVVVRPRLARRKFNLMQFIRDLFSSVSTAKYLNGKSDGIEIIAVHGTSTEVCKASFKEAALKQRPSVTSLDFNSGEVILRFCNGTEEEATVLRDLKSAKGDLRSIFRRYNLKFMSVRRGSIKFRFTLPPETDSFDSLAAEERIRQFLHDLCSYDSFKQLAERQHVTVEFLCRARLNTISVVQAQTLYVQVGNQNNVYISDLQPPALAGRDEEDSSEQDEHRPEEREFLSFNVISMSPRNQAIQVGEDRLDHPEDENRIDEVDPNSAAIPVLIKCQDSSAADDLFTEWSNSLPLFSRLYPNCRLKRARQGVLWELLPTHVSYLQVNDFIADLFHTRRLKDIKARCHLQIDVPVSRRTSDAVMTSREIHQGKEDKAKFDEEHYKLCIYVVISFVFLVTIITWIGKEECSVLSTILSLLLIYGFIRYVCPCMLKMLILFWKLVPMDGKIMISCLMVTLTRVFGTPLDMTVWFLRVYMDNDTSPVK